MRTLAAAAAILLPALAAARPTLSARLAVAPALGQVAVEVPMGDALEAQVPLQVDALWRRGALSAGGYASFGLGRIADVTCGVGADCSGRVWRVGLQGTWDFRPTAGWPPAWAGAGLGWEWASWRRERLGSEVEWGYGGPEAFLQGGLEWRLGGRLALGPYALVALGRYRSASLETGIGDASSDIPERAFHAWIHLGVRGRIDL